MVKCCNEPFPMIELKVYDRSTFNEEEWNHWQVQSESNGVNTALWLLDMVAPNFKIIADQKRQFVLPFYEKKKYFIKYAIQPKYLQQFVAIGLKSNDLDLYSQAWKMINSNYRFVAIQLPVRHLIGQVRSNYILNLKPDYELQLAGYNENTKRNIKKAITSNTSIIESANVQEAIEIFNETKGVKINKKDVNGDALLHKILQKATHHGALNAYTAFNSQGVLAYAFFINHRNESLFLFSATKVRNTGALACIIDHHIRKIAGKMQTLNFEGSDFPPLAKFYQGFGALLQPYSLLRSNRLGWPMKLFVPKV